VLECFVSQPFGRSDHNTVVAEVIFGTEVIEQKPRRNFRKADFDSILGYLLNVSWDDCFSTCSNVNHFWNVFHSHMTWAIEQFVPLTRPTASKSQYPNSLKRLQAKKLRLWKKLSQTRNAKFCRFCGEGGERGFCCSEVVTLRLQYERMGKIVRKQLRDFGSERELKLIGTRDDKAFFRYVNSKMGQPSTVPPVTNNLGILVTDDMQKATLFNDFFCSVFVSDDGNIPDNEAELNSVRQVSRVHFTPAVVREALLNLSPKYSFGPDGLPSVLLRATADAICFPLSTIFRVSFFSHEIPDVWRNATVIPLFKKGKMRDVSNYRPVSLTCVCCRVMEMIVKVVIVDHLESNSLLSSLQHGFRKNHSTNTQLLECWNKWSDSCDRGVSVDVIYLDFAKAFDKVCHSKLLFKLESCGLSGDLLDWCRSFLSNRSQSVRVGKCLSPSNMVTSGVPQGSVLGPIFFLVYVNDVVNVQSDCNIHLFADDIKIYREISCPNDNVVLNSSLNCIAEWAATWQLSLNIDKCSVLSFGKSQFCYTVNDIPLSVTTLQTDLGIIVSADGTFSPHCVNVVKRAMLRVNMLFRCFVTKKRSFLVRAYITYVRPILEYGCEIWSPHLVKDISLIESVQRSFTRRIRGLNLLSYPERLKVLELELLESRRIKCDLLMCFKIVRGLSCLHFDDFFSRPIRLSNRGHSEKLQILPCNRDLRKYSFALRVVPHWNSLSENTVSSPTVSVFKSSMKCLEFPNLLDKYV